MGKSKRNTNEIMEKRIATIYNIATLIKDPKLILDAMGLISSKVYKKVPEKCPVCKHKEFAEVAILGVYSKPLLWECIDCSALFLKYKKNWVIQQFNHIEDVWTNLSDWEVPDKDKFN